MNILQNLVGMKDMTEQVIATDFLLNIKASIKDYATAISEVRTPEAREILRTHLMTALDTHEKVISYMMRKGFYHVHDPQQQLKVDMQTADTALKLK
jgi:similar to spore coat protein